MRNYPQELGHEDQALTRGGKLVYPHASDYGKSMERKDVLDHFTEIRMKFIIKQKRQQKRIQTCSKGAVSPFSSAKIPIF